MFSQKKLLTLLQSAILILLLSFGFVRFASADVGAPDDEIHYGGVAEAVGDEILIKYEGPSEDEYFTCSLESGECSTANETTHLVPDQLTGAGDIISPNGNYALKVSALDAPSGPMAFYMLYDISGSSSKLLTIIPLNDLTTEKMFSDDGKSIVFVTTGGDLVRYDISSKDLTRTELPGTDLPFFMLAPSGEYASSYDYVSDAHRIYNLDTGAVEEVPAGEPGYVAFAGNGLRAAYKADTGDFDALYAVELGGDKNGSFVSAPEMIAGGESNFIIKDHLFAGGSIYYMANKERPLTWNIYEYDFDTKDTTKVAEDVSYGKFMKEVSGELLYQKVKGKNANISAFDPKTRETTLFEPVGPSPVTDEIARKAVHLESGRYGALLSPKGEADGNLFIWLHGGPMRQTSVGYHSYLSYAVYDELLERLAMGGAHVLKLDYTGSRGYGDEVEDGLEMQVGVADVKDVVSAAKEMKEDLDIDDIYLIGNSYGGYLSLKALVEKPELFDGAVSISGVTDWYSLINRIPSSPFKELFNGTPNLNNLEAYMDASIYKEIPELGEDEKILVEWGKEDTLVPNWQSEDFVEFVEEFGVDVETLVFENEGHIIRGRESLNELCDAVVGRFDLDEVHCELH